MKRKYMTESSSTGVASSSNAVQPGEVYDDEPSGDTENIDRLMNHFGISTYMGIEWNASLFPTDPPLPPDCGRRCQWHEIIVGTLNFRQVFFLGKDNFGEVYRCHFLETNEYAAVKIQDRTNPSTGHAEFLAEVITLHKADNRNVIRLLGRCYGRRHRAIVYDFMPNGSLDRHIFVNEKQDGRPQVLDWDRRMKIALGVAQGLLYTHQVLKVIHRDVKAENVLLDANLVPKLTDFGSATQITENQNGGEEQRKMYPIRGTPGWIAPETTQSGMVSTKSDVYSYGVFLLVLFTGRKPIDTEKSFVLTDWAMGIWSNLEYAPVDVTLGNQYSVEGLESIYSTAMMCINLEPSARPAMSVVERMVLQAAAFTAPNVERRQSW